MYSFPHGGVVGLALALAGCGALCLGHGLALVLEDSLALLVDAPVGDQLILYLGWVVGLTQVQHAVPVRPALHLHKLYFDVRQLLGKTLQLLVRELLSAVPKVIMAQFLLSSVCSEDSPFFLMSSSSKTPVSIAVYFLLISVGISSLWLSSGFYPHS